MPLDRDRPFNDAGQLLTEALEAISYDAASVPYYPPDMSMYHSPAGFLFAANPGPGGPPSGGGVNYPAGGGPGQPPSGGVSTVNFPAVPGTAGQLIVFNSSTPISFVMPPPPQLGGGWWAPVYNEGSAAVTITVSGGLLLVGGVGVTVYVLPAGGSIWIWCDGVNYLILGCCPQPPVSVPVIQGNLFVVPVQAAGQIIVIQGNILNVTLPDVTLIAAGWSITLDVRGGNDVLILVTGNVTINGQLNWLLAAQTSALVYWDGSAWWVLLCCYPPGPPLLITTLTAQIAWPWIITNIQAGLQRPPRRPEFPLITEPPGKPKIPGQKPPPDKITVLPSPKKTPIEFITEIRNDGPGWLGIDTEDQSPIDGQPMIVLPPGQGTRLYNDGQQYWTFSGGYNVSLQGYPVDATIPSLGSVLIFDGTQWTRTPPAGDLGDSGKAYFAPIVIGLQGKAVSATAPTDGQALIWSASTAQWTPQSPAGDLAGSYADPTVVALQGKAIAATAPADGQVLTWSNADQNWEPKAAGGGGTTSDNGSTRIAQTDVTGTLASVGSVTLPTSGATYLVIAQVAGEIESSGAGDDLVCQLFNSTRSVILGLGDVTAIVTEPGGSVGSQGTAILLALVTTAHANEVVEVEAAYNALMAPLIAHVSGYLAYVRLA